MESLKALASTNLKISEAEATLLKLQSAEKDYLEEREKKTFDMIQKIFENSKELIEKTKFNYDEVVKFYNVTVAFSSTLNEMWGKYETFIAQFNERNMFWEETYKNQMEELAKLTADSEKRNKDMDEREILLNERKKVLDNQALHLESKQQALKVTYEEIKRLKE